MPHTIRNVPSFLHALIEPILEGVHQCLAAYLQYPSHCSIAAYDWQPDTSSHVVLAGCQENQYAWEVNNAETTHDIFTKSLMDALRSDQLRGCTYTGLISGLPKWLHQMPFIAGDHKDGPVWY